MLEISPVAQDSQDRRGIFTEKKFVQELVSEQPLWNTLELPALGRKLLPEEGDSEGKMLIPTSQHIPAPPRGFGVQKKGHVSDKRHVQWAQCCPYLGTHRGMSYALKHLYHCSLF